MEQRYGIRRLLSLARPQTKPLLIGAAFLAVSSGALLAYPQMVRVIVDEALGSGDKSRIDRAALIILACFVVQALTSALRYYYFTISGERIVATLRKDLYAKIIEQEIGFFDARRTGELVSRLASDTTLLQNAVSVNISMLVRNAAGTVGGLALLIYTSPPLTLAMLAALPPIGIGVAVFGKKVRALAKDAQDAVARAGVVAEETISGIRTVRAFAQERREGARYGAAIDDSFAVSRRKIVTISNFTAGASLVGYAAIVAVVWYGGRLVIAKELSVGNLTTFVLYTLTVAVSVGTLGGLWTDFMAATGAARRIFELMDRTPAIPLAGGEALAEVKGDIQFDAVSFAYPSRPDVTVLKELTLHLAPGEIVALVGPSGGGKSTIAGLIPRFYDATSGVVRVDGHDVRALDGSRLRRFFGIVAQEPVLISATIGDNIRYGRHDEASDAAVRAAAKAANALDFIAAFPQGFGTIVGERGIQLSGGQKQRIAIARAVLRDPRILILDEATSALDAESEHLVKDALDRLMRGRTTLVIAHRLSTVKDAHRVIVLEGGRVVQQGTHAALMREEAGLYKRLVERQFFQG
jgi:ATP-binding cassette subfamily B protein